MKIENTSEINSVVVVNGTAEKTEFKISQNQKIFQLLSSKIYSDKIKSPMRELSCNAYDAHVAAGKEDTPIEVHLPTTKELWFSVRDFGNGMSKEFIEDLYSNYGYSDKTNSNELIGCLGIGSKSPFAYTKKFFVTSVKDGVEVAYVCDITSGMPTLLLVGEGKTNKPSGTEVKFNVEYSDVCNFSNAAAQFYKYFMPHPVITGDYNCIIPAFPEFEENVSYISNAYHSDSYILMGNVTYAFNMELVRNAPIVNETSKDIRNEFYNKFNYTSFVLKVAMGEVDFTGDRENIEMTGETADLIAQRMLDYAAFKQKQYTEAISKEKTLFDKWKKALELEKEIKFNKILDSKSGEFCKQINEKILIRNNKDADEYYSYYARSSAYKYFIKCSGYNNGRLNTGSKYGWEGISNCGSNHYVFIHADLGMVVRDWLKDWARKYKIPAGISSIYFLLFENQKCKKGLEDCGIEYLTLSGLKPEKTSSGYSSRSSSRVETPEFYEIGSELSITNKTDKIELKDDSIVYYVPVRNRAVVTAGTKDQSDLKQVVQHFKNNILVGIPVSKIAKIKGDKRYVDALTEFRKEAKKKTEKLVQLSVKEYLYSRLISFGHVEKNYFDFFKLDKNTSKIIKDWKDASDEISKNSLYYLAHSSEILDLVSKEKNKIKTFQDWGNFRTRRAYGAPVLVVDIIEQIHQKYPLFVTFDGNEKSEAVKEYINLINKKH